MKKHICILLVLLCLLLPACGTSDVLMPEASQPTEAAVFAPEVPQPSTEPVHSALYLPGVPAEDVIMYFEEVCLDAEFADSGDPHLLQKWRIPICYTLYGNYTEADTAVLTEFSAWLNSIEGFPGIRPAREGDIETLRIYFCEETELAERMGEPFWGQDGAVRFWYDRDEIYNAIICCRSDLSQFTRNSVLLEELYNGLGPIQDTSLRPDSIIYSEFSEPQQLTQIDELILKLLYHPDLTCGMNRAQCAAAIRKLYY